MDRTERLRVLVIAYDFPPHGAIGTMRTLRLVRQLAREGWDVRVLTSDARTFRPGTPVEPGLLEQVPGSVTVVRAPAVRGFEALKRLVRPNTRAKNAPAEKARPTGASDTRRHGATRIAELIEAALTIPDHEAAWWAPAVTRALWACRKWRPHVVYSSAPPWTGQIVAATVATALRCPWVADFRDPWARAPWREARRPFVKHANAVLEGTVVSRADAVLFVTRGNLEEFSAFYGADARRRFHLVPNGCDPSEFADLGASAPPSQQFVMLHAGSLYGARNPVVLIRAVANAIARGALARHGFRLRFLGPISLGIDLSAECDRLGVADVVELMPRVSRSESLRQMASASALLLVQPVTTVSVPGKAYEYLAAGRPVLALAEEGDIADLVRRSGIGVSIPPDAGVDAIEAALLEIIEIASKPYQRPPSALYDGRVHAATTERLLRQLGGSGGRARGTDSAVCTGTAAVAAHVEEPPQ
jgi:glycosyltransferase involved in cell wall biosynthesis